MTWWKKKLKLLQIGFFLMISFVIFNLNFVNIIVMKIWKNSPIIQEIKLNFCWQNDWMTWSTYTVITHFSCKKTLVQLEKDLFNACASMWNFEKHRSTVLQLKWDLQIRSDLTYLFFVIPEYVFDPGLRDGAGQVDHRTLGHVNIIPVYDDSWRS